MNDAHNFRFHGVLRGATGLRNGVAKGVSSSNKEYRVPFFVLTLMVFLVGPLLQPVVSYASSAASGEHMKQAPINEDDIVSKQRGARLFVNYCYGCHSLKYLRYERISEDLRIPKDLVKENLMFTGSKIGDQMQNAMTREQASQWFGAVPPDLTLEARLRGVDWIYSYLISFYPDKSRPWGVNNHVFKDVGMPHVLEDLQVALGPEDFESAMADLTNFLAYAAEPTKHKRERIGVFVLLFLTILAIPIYFLNREYWKDVK